MKWKCADSSLSVTRNFGGGRPAQNRTAGSTGALHPGPLAAVCDGKIAFSGVANVSDFLQQLRELPGIGDWTAEYVAMRALNEPDAFPASDLGLLRASGMHDPRELQARAEAWRPWRAYAAMYLWQAQPAADRSSRSAVSAKNKIAQGKISDPERGECGRGFVASIYEKRVKIYDRNR